MATTAQVCEFPAGFFLLRVAWSGDGQTLTATSEFDRYFRLRVENLAAAPRAVR